MHGIACNPMCIYSHIFTYVYTYMCNQAYCTNCHICTRCCSKMWQISAFLLWLLLYCEPYACQYPLYTLPPSTLTQAKESDFFCNLVSGCSGCDPGRFSLFLPKHASSHIYDAGNFLARVCLCACVCVCVCVCV